MTGHGHGHDHGHHHDHAHDADATARSGAGGPLLYIDAIGGVAGDMLLGALIDAGASFEQIEAAVRRLVDGIRIEVVAAERHAIGATAVRVSAPAEPGVSRTWADVQALLAAAGLLPRIEERAQRAFALLAEAEGRVHGVPAEAVHFHEVGGIDAIADVVGVCAALEALGVDRIEASPLPLARGTTEGAHGRIPLPAPAVVELLRGAPVVPALGSGETVTPTGAALVAALAGRWGDLPAMEIGTVGYGAGHRDDPVVPNVVRVLVGRPSGVGRGDVAVIEATIDDLSPELVPDALDEVRGAGALDAWTAPVATKHGRPAVVVTALARPAHREAVAEALFRSTSTLGVRITHAERIELERDWVTVDVAGESVRVKRGILRGAVVNLAPEHRDCVAAAGRLKVPVRRVWESALAVAQEERG